MRFHLPNTSFPSICKPLLLNAAKKIKIKDDSSGVKINPLLRRIFRNLKRVVGFLTIVKKDGQKSYLPHPNHFKLDTTHLWTIANISCVIKMIMSTSFLLRFIIIQQQFCLSFKFYLCLKSTVFLKSNELNLFQMCYYYLFLMISAIFKTQEKP